MLNKKLLTLIFITSLSACSVLATNKPQVVDTNTSKSNTTKYDSIIEHLTKLEKKNAALNDTIYDLQQQLKRSNEFNTELNGRVEKLERELSRIIEQQRELFQQVYKK